MVSDCNSVTVSFALAFACLDISLLLKVAFVLLRLCFSNTWLDYVEVGTVFEVLLRELKHAADATDPCPLSPRAESRRAWGLDQHTQTWTPAYTHYNQTTLRERSRLGTILTTGENKMAELDFFLLEPDSSVLLSLNVIVVLRVPATSASTASALVEPFIHIHTVSERRTIYETKRHSWQWAVCHFTQTHTTVVASLWLMLWGQVTG